jgi:hypothetical protein
VVLGLVLVAGGARGPGSLLLLAAIVAGATRLIEAVGLAAEGRSGRFPVLTAGAGLVWLVAAGAAHLPWVALGLLACSALDLLGGEVENRTAAAPAERVELQRAA